MLGRQRVPEIHGEVGDLEFTQMGEVLEERLAKHAAVVERIWSELAVLGALSLTSHMLVQGGALGRVSLLAYGDPGGETSMARTVGITTAIAVDLVLKGAISERGMLTPVAKEVYEPALELLEAEGFAFSETTTAL